MRVLVFLLAAMFGCITDDGAIDEACDEVPEPCVWEYEDSTDTGTEADVGSTEGLAQ